MFEVMRPCKDMIQNCTWLGSMMPCENLFKIATSSEGFCCSFNYKPPLDPKLMYIFTFLLISIDFHIDYLSLTIIILHWPSLTFIDLYWTSLTFIDELLISVISINIHWLFLFVPSPRSLTESDYIEDTDFSNHRISGAGPSVGLEALIGVSKSDYYSYIHTYYGVSVYVHGFESFPQPPDKVLIVQPGTDVQISVMPSVLVSSRNVRSLPIALRNCLFDDEVYYAVKSYLHILFNHYKYRQI